MPGDRPLIGDLDALLGRLRPARRSDAPALLALKRQAYGKYVPRIDAEPQPMVADYALMIEDHAIWLIDHPDGAGLLAALVLRAEHDALVVWSVAVAPAAQRQGLGGRLLAFAEAEARRAGLRQLRLFTNEMFTENLALYRRLGYHETGREDYRGRVLVHLHKPLDEPSPKLG